VVGEIALQLGEHLRHGRVRIRDPRSVDDHSCCGRLLAHAGSNSFLEPVSVREEQQPVGSDEDLVRRDEISMTDPTVGGRGGRDHHGPGPAPVLGTPTE